MSLLTLEDNLLNNADAAMIAKSLTTNTNLRKLGITVGNSITPVGLKSFLSAVLNTSSFNAISDSNHTCWIANRYEGLSKLNTHLDSKVNNTEKLIIALDIEANMPLLSTIPIELMPRVLYLIQGRGFFESQSLSRTFRFIRQWCMPLLYTSCIGLELRRSDRVRKKMVMNCMMIRE